MTSLPDKLITELRDSGSLKVWSLIITFFGDAVEPRGGIVAASTLQSVMEVMGVGSGAVRTACSRLAKDGWIERQKQGRNSFYRLSNMGHTPFRKAGRQIYAAPVDPQKDKHCQPKKFSLVMQHPLNNTDYWQTLCDRGIRINGSCVLFTSGDGQLPKAISDNHGIDDMLVLSGASASIPDWIKRSVCPDKNAERYLDLMQRFSSVPRSMPADSLTSLAVRCLLIHEWRRLLLRSKPIPAELMPEDWPHYNCHRFVAKLYRELFEAGEHWMDDNALGPGGLLQTTDPNCKTRFSNNNNQSA